MTLSIEAVMSTLTVAVLASIGAYIGTIWGHHGAILRRVTYEECSRKRKDCPCFQDIEEIKDKLEE